MNIYLNINNTSHGNCGVAKLAARHVPNIEGSGLVHSYRINYWFVLNKIIESFESLNAIETTWCVHTLNFSLMPLYD